MDYGQVKELINNTLMGRVTGHEIEPQEHQDMAEAILDFAHGMEILGQSVLQGFATASTVPEQPDTVKICYIAIAPCNATTTFTNFKNQSNQSITVTCGQYEIKVVVLLWNTTYWEKMEETVNFENSITRNINGGNAAGNYS